MAGIMSERYVHITWKTPSGGWRRSFAVVGDLSHGGLLVSYHLVEKDTDGKEETVIGFAEDSSIRVRPARLNMTYCELEIVE